MSLKVKKIASKIHLWLGLICGSVVFISMLAAAIFVWDQELTEWYYGDYIFVDAGKKKLPLSQLLQRVQPLLGEKKIEDVEIFKDPSRAYIFSTYGSCSTCPGITYWSDYNYWDRVYVDPYTGEVKATVDMLYNWIDLTRRVHQNLLLRYRIGHYIVGYSTLVIFVMIITGLILWFPKNKAAFKQRFSIKWKARWRRINYDIHNVGGFYTWSIIFILAVTGLVWTFEWWTNGIYRMLGSDPAKISATHSPPPKINTVGSINALDRAYADVLTRRDAWRSMYVIIPSSTANEKEGNEIAIYMSHDGNSGWDESDSYYYNAHTGTLHYADRFENQMLGEKWRNSNYAIHVGSIYGLPTKIIASFGALFLASLPVTGLLVYLGRKNKKDKKKNKKSPSEKKSTKHTRAGENRHFELNNPQ